MKENSYRHGKGNVVIVICGQSYNNTPILLVDLLGINYICVVQSMKGTL